MNTNSRGIVSEMAVKIKLISMGYQVLEDLNKQSRTDLWIRCEGDKYVKIQIKTVSEKVEKCCRYINTASNLGKKAKQYKRSEVDFFIGVFNQSFYVIPYDSAYGGISKKRFSVNRNFLEAWHVLPKPYELIEEEAEFIDRQEVLKIA